jgi:WD40 repeat protein
MPPRRRVLVALAAALTLAAAVPLALFLPGDRQGPPDPDTVSRRLAAEALGARDDGSDLARRLAVAAYRTAPTRESRDSVYSLFAAGDQPLATLTGHTGYVSDVAFSPDGTLLATSSDDNTAGLWDTTRRGTTEPLATLTGHTDLVSGVAFSPDGTLLATSSGDGTARLWDTTRRGTTEPLATLTGHTGGVSGVAFSPDGTLLATSSGDGTARLWDTTRRGTTAPLATLTGHTGYVTGVAFSPDGTLLATSGYDNTARQWDLDAGRLVDSACADPANRMTAQEWAEYVPELPYDPPCG